MPLVLAPTRRLRHRPGRDYTRAAVQDRRRAAEARHDLRLAGNVRCAPRHVAGHPIWDAGRPRWPEMDLHCEPDGTAVQLCMGAGHL
jgi:hypothetical protein